MLGRGGFGSVYAGTFSVRGRGSLNVAVKCVALDPTSIRPEDVWTLAREVAIMRGPNHPNVLSCYAACFDATARDAANMPLGCCLILERANGSTYHERQMRISV